MTDREFLISKFGESRGSDLADQAEKRYKKLLKEADPMSKQEKKVFEGMLLGRICMYQILRESGLSQEEALKIMEEHMVILGAEPLKKKYASMDKLPCAYSLFKFGFTHIVPSSDLWEADIDTSEKDAFSVTMHRCFWNDTYRKYGCPEVCQFACACDDITYGDLKHIAYHRTQTLGTGGNFCDFTFRKKK